MQQIGEIANKNTYTDKHEEKKTMEMSFETIWKNKWHSMTAFNS